jgi:hypothetical protein
MADLADKLKIGAAITIGAPVVLGLAVVLSPVLLVLGIKDHFDSREARKRFEEDLLRLEGTCYFCYNNRKNSVDFAKEILIPHLESTVKMVFVEGKTISDLPDKHFISRILYGVKDRKGFPYLLKISNGRVLDCSVHQQFYSIINNKKSLEPLLKRIDLFYNSSAISE